MNNFAYRSSILARKLSMNRAFSTGTGRALSALTPGGRREDSHNFKLTEGGGSLIKPGAAAGQYSQAKRKGTTSTKLD